MKYEVESAQHFIEVADNIVFSHMVEGFETACAKIEMLKERKGGCGCRCCVTSVVSEANQWIKLLMDEKFHKFRALYFRVNKNMEIKEPVWYPRYLEERKDGRSLFQKGDI